MNTTFFSSIAGFGISSYQFKINKSETFISNCMQFYVGTTIITFISGLIGFIQSFIFVCHPFIGFCGTIPIIVYCIKHKLQMNDNK
jgi:hypothetical protein